MPLNALWQKHRKFLTTLVAGLAVFFLLVFFVDRYRGEAAEVERSNRRRSVDLEAKMKKLDFSYHNTMKKAESGGERLENLQNKVVISKSGDVEVPSGEGADLSIEFRKRKEAIWNSSGERAKRINLQHPSPNEVDFDLRSDLSAEEWKDRYRQLEVLKRVFEAAVDLGCRRIEDLAVENVETEEIPGTKKDVLVRYPVIAKLHLEFDELVQLYSRFQRDGSYLGIEMQEVLRDSGDPEGIVRAELMFVGIDIGAPRESDRKKPRRSGGRRRGGR